MDFEANSSWYMEFVKKYWLPLGLGSLGLILFAYGLISFLLFQKQEIVPFSQEKTASETPNLISVDIEGAVVSPGVYKIKEGSLVQDVLVSAQGLSSQADREYVAKNINLAQKISDGTKIYIPKTGEAPISSTGNINNQTGLINLNTASQAELESLPGIGAVTAAKIINNRPYSNPDELQSKKVVSTKVFSEIKDKVSTY